MSVRIIVIEHEQGTDARRFGRWLEDAGAVLDVRRPYRAVTAGGVVDPKAAIALLPTLGELRGPGTGLVVLGGRAGPVDDDRNPWFPAVRELLAASAAGEFCSFNVCLGAEMLVEALGRPVIARDMPQIGIQIAPARRSRRRSPVLLRSGGVPGGPLARAADVLPEGAVHLVDGTDAPVQAFRVGRAWGTQFHLEADGDLLRGWADGADCLPGGLNVDAVADTVAAAEAALEAAMAPVAHAFVRLLARER